MRPASADPGGEVRGVCPTTNNTPLAPAIDRSPQHQVTLIGHHLQIDHEGQVVTTLVRGCSPTRSATTQTIGSPSRFLEFGDPAPCPRQTAEKSTAVTDQPRQPATPNSASLPNVKCAAR